jgi:hypothetical protein
MVDFGGSRPRGCCSMAVAPDPRLRCRREWKHSHVARCTTSSTQVGRWDRNVRGTGRPMTSWRQFEANRRNALKSTGPKSLEGSGYRGATPFGTGSPPKPSSTVWRTPRIIAASKPRSSQTTMPRPRSNGNSCCVFWLGAARWENRTFGRSDRRPGRRRASIGGLRWPRAL